MISINNNTIFEQTVAEALSLSAQKLSGKPLESIAKQIARAVVEIESNPFLQFDRETETLSVFSRSSWNAYTVKKGECFRGDGNLCPAKKLCWYRVCRRLLSRNAENTRLMTITVELEKSFFNMKAQPKKQVEIRPEHQIRRVKRTDKQGREYYVEMVGSIPVSDRIYSTKTIEGAKQ